MLELSANQISSPRAPANHKAISNYRFENPTEILNLLLEIFTK